MVTDLIPASSPSSSSVTVTLYPLRSAQRIYIRMSIADQSFASVPPAPELIVSTAPRLSPSSPSIFLSSSASSSSSTAAYACSSSSTSGVCASSPAPERLSFAKSYRTLRSSAPEATLSKPLTQNFTPESSFRNFSASLGSSQKSGAKVFS